MMRYPRGTSEILITICAYIINIVEFWEYGYHGVHPNRKVHTGLTQSLGKGLTIINIPVRISILEVPSRQNWLLWIILCHMKCGQDIF